jgi:nucleotide-binding universal stress UspA family protein
MTTHGRTGLSETILGSVAHRVVHGASRPVLLYRPRGGSGDVDVTRQAKIDTVVALLDGSEFSERILPHAVGMARAAAATLTLVQVVPAGFTKPPMANSGDVLETNYIHRWAGRIRSRDGIAAEWDVLHGQPADAICHYAHDRPEVILAMSSHARPRLVETVFGGVTHECVRRAGVPILVWSAPPGPALEATTG